MKKLIYVLLAFTIMFTGVVFSACNEEETYQADTNARIQTFLENEDNAFLFGATPGITYKTGIQAEIDSSNPEYLELNTLYFNVLNSLTYMFKNTYTNLEIAPVYQEKATKTAFEDFIKDIDELQSNIDTFLVQKQTFEDNVIANFDGSQALQELKEFKRDFANLIYATQNFNDGFENLYLTAYLNIPSNQVETLATGIETLVGNIVIGELLDTYILYAFDDNNNTIRDTASNLILDKVAQIKSAVSNPVIKENNAQLFNELLTHFQAFGVETNHFKECLQVVNMKSYDENPTSYLDENPSQEAHITTILNFEPNAVTIYTGKILDLIS